MWAVKRDLELKRRALTSAIQASIGSSREPDRRESLKDPYGSASLTHEDEVLAAVVDRRAREVEQIDRALEDIEAGRYGMCRDCATPIAKARLRAMPLAVRCVACQARHEGARRAA